MNAELGGSAGLNKLVADAKRLCNATMSYHIDVDISNSMTPTQVRHKDIHCTDDHSCYSAMISFSAMKLGTRDSAPGL